jgi:hypothetical protein
MERRTAALSLFEVLPLLRALKRLISGARPLRPTDLALPSEARSQQDAVPAVDRRRVAVVESAMQALAGELSAFVAKAERALADPSPASLTASVDTLAAEVATLLGQAALFGLPGAGREFVRDFRRRLFAGVLAQAHDLTVRWTSQLADFDARIAEHDALPAAAGADPLRVLAIAETAISTRPIVPRPPTAAEIRALLVETKRPAFAARRDRFASLQRTARTRVADLMADLRALLPIGDFDPAPYVLTAHDQAIRGFVAEAITNASSVQAALTRRMSDAAAPLAAHDATAVAIGRADALEAAAKALLGDDLVLVPRYDIDAAQVDEVANALAASRSGALFDHLVHPPGGRMPPLDFPVDTWLHGAARVRDRLHAWEQAVILTGAFGRAEPALDAIQLPHLPGDRWIGLDVPSDLRLDADRLLYTAHFAAPLDASRQLCGLLLDEWTETIPASELDTGIALHFDRPNAESPQAMLLVAPSEFRGGWQWDDLLDALNETIDLAKRRAVEPSHIDRLPLAPYLPATIMASQVGELTIAANLPLNNSALPPGD